MGKSSILLVILIIAVTALLCFGLLVVFFPDPSTIDSDNDGVMNNEDMFPNDPEEFIDTDDDGVGDASDDFPTDPAASLDSDSDGYPDDWNPGKTQNDSTTNPPLIKDVFPFDPYEWMNSDEDDVGDNHDKFPYDSSEWADDDNDVIGNKKDRNPLVNLSFTFRLDSFTLLKNVDFLPRGQIYFELYVNDDKKVSWNNDGSYWRVWKNKETRVNKEFSFDIDDTTTESYTNIEIIMYDYDVLFSDDIIDVNAMAEKETIVFRLHHEENRIITNYKQMGPDASITYSFLLPDLVEPEQYMLQKTYKWSFLGESFVLDVEIPYEKYEWYKTREINRRPQSMGITASSAMASFVTTGDRILQHIGDQLKNIAEEQQYNESETANFVLDFVQTIVKYENDSISKECTEYWRYPLETLVDQVGDCEDSSVLYATLMGNIDYDMVLLFYVLEDGTGHLASGVHLMTPIGFDPIEYDNLPYYYCETTNQGFVVGTRPKVIPEEPKQIIRV